MTDIHTFLPFPDGKRAGCMRCPYPQTNLNYHEQEAVSTTMDYTNGCVLLTPLGPSYACFIDRSVGTVVTDLRRQGYIIARVCSDPTREIALTESGVWGAVPIEDTAFNLNDLMSRVERAEARVAA